jgi:hypothetical protein
MARVYTQKTRKERTCGRCRDTIKPGETYRSAAPGWRGSTLIRCSKATCYFRQSELTTSNMSGVYAAQENAEDEINGISIDENERGETVFKDDLDSILEACAEGITEAAELYRDASSNWAGGERPNDEWDEIADQLDDAADEVRDFDPDEWDEKDDETWDEYLDRVKSDAVDHVNGITLP